MIKKTYFILAICLFLFACQKNNNTLQSIKATQLVIDSTIVSKKSIAQFITPFKEHLNKQLDSVLCYTTGDLTKTDGQLESSLGNLMADICFTEGSVVINKKHHKTVDFVLLNHGGIRAPISKGNITARNAFEVMPFENELVAVELSGQQISHLLNYLYTHKKAHPIANMQLQLNSSGHLNTYINNKAFQPEKTYTVLTSDYLQQGGDNMTFFSNPIAIYKTNYKIRDVMINYFKKTAIITPTLDQRFSYAN